MNQKKEPIEFVYWDDLDIVNAPLMEQPISLTWIQELLSQTTISLWTPVSNITHYLDVQLFGLSATEHHISSIFWHIAASISLYWALLLLGERAKGQKPLWNWSKLSPLLIALLFLLHPMHVESWAWISDRKGLLSALCAHLSLGFWIQNEQYKKRKKYLFSLFFLLLGLASKPAVTPWPLILALTSWVFFERAWHQIALRILPHFCLATGFALITWLIQNERSSGGDYENFSFLYKVLFGLEGYGIYLKQAIFPSQHSFFYPLSLHLSEMLGYALFGGISSLALLIAAAIYRSKMPWLTYSILFYLLCLLPLAGFIMSSDSAHPDRYTYISYTGLFILFVKGLELVYQRLAPSYIKKKLLTFVYGLLLISTLLVMTVTSIQQALTWKNSVTMAQHSLRINPINYKAFEVLAKYYYAQKQDSLAEKYLLKRLQLFPGNTDLWIFMGGLQMKKYNWQEASHWFAKAHHLGQSNSTALFARWALCELRMNHPKKAMNLIQKVSKEDKQDPRVTETLKLIESAL